MKIVLPGFHSISLNSNTAQKMFSRAPPQFLAPHHCHDPQALARLLKLALARFSKVGPKGRHEKKEENACLQKDKREKSLADKVYRCVFASILGHGNFVALKLYQRSSVINSGKKGFELHLVYNRHSQLKELA